ncbi:MAG: Maltodextrin ABC transporter, substrate-binding protein MdxE [uncultured Nocardioides sp.]|uniref:Maltodextrin ABC transporter, substrate-binding protein MdxE n=1 Tax=uncultured Nocardioides sp. TaxID=198441 RepID=A0A6J4NPH7_9ACTN|nr:MAG: Maltodextrin ABC transporter, substrate-binding protein MdxE [uncultured Nocardioides sp.]
MTSKRLIGAAALTLVAWPLAACGGDGGGSTSGGGENPAFEEGLDSRGPITYVQGKDNSGVWPPLIEKWNADHPDEKVTFKEQTDEADQQHDDLVRNLQAENAEYDVVSVDVVWTAEFAAKGWLQPLEGDLAVNTEGLLEPTITAGEYNGTLYTSPSTSDGGMLYYRTDLVKTPPKTWDEMMEMCSIAKKNNMDCYTGQFNKYEGLTVNASEAINGAGGQIVGENGQTPEVDSPEAAEGLGNLAEAFANGNIPKQAISFTEEEGRIAFQAGKTLFHRNWPYVYGLAATEDTSKVKGKFDVAPLPGTDGIGASTLGGHNLGISAYSDNKATAIDFVNFVLEEEQQRFLLEKGSLAPALESLYTDEALVKKFGYLPTLQESIANAVPRPISPFYPGVTQAIQDNAYAAIKGDVEVEQALADMADAITAASQGS